MIVGKGDCTFLDNAGLDTIERDRSRFLDGPLSSTQLHRYKINVGHLESRHKTTTVMVDASHFSRRTVRPVAHIANHATRTGTSKTNSFEKTIKNGLSRQDEVVLSFLVVGAGLG